MSGAVIIRCCASVEEAVVVWSLLRSGGFEASIDNYYHATLDWLKIHALGGVYISVPEDELIAAGKFLIDSAERAEHEFGREFTSPHDWSVRRPILKSWTMPFLEYGGVYVLAYAIFLFLTLLPEDTLYYYTDVSPLIGAGPWIDGLDVAIIFGVMFGGYIILVAFFSALAHFHTRDLQRRKKRQT